jgi:hypothetical protein
MPLPLTSSLKEAGCVEATRSLFEAASLVAEVLPLNYTRKKRQNMSTKNENKKQVLPVKMVPIMEAKPTLPKATRF